MSGQYPVTATVTPIFPSAQPDAQTVKNTGLVTVYLGSSSSVSVLGGYALGPGSAISWDAGKPLFAVTASGFTALTVLDNGGSLFDASAVAGQLQVGGVPPIDVNAVIFTASYTASGSDYVSPAIDVSKYQSITVRVSEIETVSASPVARQVEMQWMDSSGSNVRDTDGFALTGTNNAPSLDAAFFTTYQGPVRGPDLTLKIRANGHTGNTVNVQVVGSYKALSSPRYVCRSASWVSAGNNLFAGKGFDNYASFLLNNLAGNTTTYYYPPVKGGTALFAFDCQGPVGAILQVAVLDLDANVLLYNSGQITVPANGIITTTSTQLIVGNRPLAFFIQTSGSASVWSFVRGSLSYLDHS